MLVFKLLLYLKITVGVGQQGNRDDQCGRSVRLGCLPAVGAALTMREEFNSSSVVLHPCKWEGVIVHTVRSSGG